MGSETRDGCTGLLAACNERLQFGFALFDLTTLRVELRVQGRQSLLGAMMPKLLAANQNHVQNRENRYDP
jgi:hypothetical protein